MSAVGGGTFVSVLVPCGVPILGCWSLLLDFWQVVSVIFFCLSIEEA